MAPAHTFVEIRDPETGHLITVARRLDAVGKLYASNQITNIQHQAALAYQADVEATTGSLRAPSRGPSDLNWRGRPPQSDRKRRDRLDRAHARLGPDLSRLALAVLIDGQALHRDDVRQLHQALDKLAVAYGYATATRH
jgi:hypothetical protein